MRGRGREANDPEAHVVLGAHYSISNEMNSAKASSGGPLVHI